MWARQTRPHSAATFSRAAQQELTEASRLLDLSEHRLGQLLAQAIEAFVAAGLDFLPHRGEARAAALSHGRMLRPPRRDISVNAQRLQRDQIGIGAIASVGRQLRRSCGRASLAATIGVS